jgi:hypothetical protein
MYQLGAVVRQPGGLPTLGNAMPDAENLIGNVAQRGQFVNLPAPKRGGMFGGATIDLSRALAGFLAGMGNPAGVRALQSLNAMRQRQLEHQQELDDYARKRADDRSDFTFEQDYKAAHPAPVNNDTVADYNFWKSVLPPDQFQQYVANKVNPPQLMEVPGVGIVSVPRMAPQQGVPSAPVGKLTPLGAGGPTPSASGGFPY